jgi:DNA repair exonuclease SbcCD ATPase subunit
VKEERIEELTGYAGVADDYKEHIRQLEAEIASERSAGSVQLAEVQRLEVVVEEASKQEEYLQSQMQQLIQQKERLEKAGKDAENVHYAEQQELCGEIKDLEGKLAEAEEHLKGYDGLTAAQEASQLREVGLTDELEKLKGTLQEKEREIERLNSEILNDQREFEESSGQFEEFNFVPARTGQSKAPEGTQYDIEAEHNELAEEVEYYKERADTHAFTIQDLQLCCNR